ncbi:helix-turn-helix transcriptional regulator [Actinotalea ferrariae]|uniref:helix-turn-helix domain-containing protein n=1 Tax=Actinotalea ferrariae TaxID=1386098 RepID=UPI001C8CC034|nr:helix-turn-helix domain-containing protein [Actinotalea ferrariae]MBX9243428.1 helix-turn-helix transcriptional regulator [Actinotalea ferrariae]
MDSPRDKAIGENVVRLRGPLSQAALADAMRARGWKWSQATVWSVEQGERPLRLAEAVDLAGLLECEIEDLIALDYQMMLTMGARKVRESAHALERAIGDYHIARMALGLLVEKVNGRRDVNLGPSQEALDQGAELVEKVRLAVETGTHDGIDPEAP